MVSKLTKREKSSLGAIIGNERNKFRLLRLYGDGSKPPYCKCYCGKKVTWNKEKKKWNKYVYGHTWNTRTITLPQMYCLCGCNELTTPGRRYIIGHNPKGKKIGYKKICPHCHKVKGTSIHHIIPREFDGSDIKENKIRLCNKCHDKVEILTSDLLSKRNYTIDILKFFIKNCFPNEDIIKDSRYYEVY